ncbi:MAG: hypothetical protein ACK523_21435, partial [Pirellulaceae bacterium]
PISRKAPRSPCRERSRAGYNQSLVTGWFSRAVHRSEGKIHQLDHQHGQGVADLVQLSIQHPHPSVAGS